MLLCIITALCIGYIYCFGSIERFYIETFHWKHEDLNLAFSLALITFSLGNLWCGIYLKKSPIYRFMLLSAGFFLGGFMILSLTKTIWMFYIGFGIFCGIATGLAYQSMLSFLHALPLKQSGIVDGAVLCGFALSGTICGSFINILNVYLSWRLTLMMACTCSIILILLTGVLMAFHNHTVIQKNAAFVWGGDMLRSRSFLFFISWSIIIGSFAMGHLSNASSILYHNKTPFIAYIPLTLPLCNALGRFLYTLSSAFLSLKRFIKIVNVGMMISLLSFSLFLLTEEDLFYILSAILSLLNFGCITAMLPQCIEYLYGSLYFSIHYAICNLQALITSTIGPLLLLFFLHSFSSCIMLLILCFAFYSIGKKLIVYFRS